MAWNSLSQKYNRRDVLYDLSSFLRNFNKQDEVVDVSKKKYEYIDSAYCLGKNDLFSVFEIHHHHVSDARVGLTRQAVEIMRSRRDFTQRAIFFFVPKNSDTFRISLVTFDWANNKPNNPRRYSFLVGKDQQVHTAIKQLSSAATNEEDLLKRFSIEVVNDEFYKKISEHFEDLLKAIEYPNICPQEKLEETKRNFAVRLIGRLIFCWFLKKKIRQDGSALIPEKLLSSKVVEESENYYHEILEPLFFETLNKQSQNRIPKCRTGLFEHIPFLNGGLFEAHEPEDGYKYDEKTETCYLGMAITIPNSWFVKFFETLETYNFTIDENTSTDIDLAVDPEMLGRIFENLLASINPETKESVRKATGSYYTPREIVDYMVTQSLKQYLYTKTDISHTVIDSLFEFEPQVDEDKLPLTQKQKIYAALEEIKVLDPAVGSGAFPMGVLQKMLSIINLVVPQKNTYNTKLSLIQKCIYGVDIQPMAIEICGLRFFLTLIVEEESDNPKPLPNLNFNFACANTLIPLDNNNISELTQKIQDILEQIKEKKLTLPIKGQNLLGLSKEEQKQIKAVNKDLTKLNREKESLRKQLEEAKADINTFLNGENYIAQLRDYRKKFFLASGKQKEDLKRKFSATQDDMLHALQENDWGNDKVLKLQAWRPFDNVSTGWFDPFWMFGVEDGFDIVIANPPYIGDKGHRDIFKPIQNSLLGKFYKGKMDFFYFFFHLALNLLKDNGICSFITTNYFVTATHAVKLREDLCRRAQPISFVNFNELKIFKSALGQHNLISTLKKSNEQNSPCKCVLCNEIGVATPMILSSIFGEFNQNTLYFNIEQNSIFEGTEKYIRIEPTYASNILRKLTNVLYDTLGNIADVEQGLHTGADEVTDKHLKHSKGSYVKGDGIFIISQQEKDSLHLSAFENEKVKDFFKNSDIKQYYTNVRNTHYLIDLFYPNDRDIDIKKYSTLINHLSKYKKILCNRKDTANGMQKAIQNGYWYCGGARKTLDYDSPKIVAPQRSILNAFGYNEVPWYASADVYFITNPKTRHHLKYILALLNSKLYYFWLYWRGKRKGKSLELYQEPLSEIPIKKADDKTQKEFVAIVDKILSITQSDDYLSNSDKQSRVKAYQDEIDQMVYKLYGLTDEEIKIVEASQPKKK